MSKEPNDESPAHPDLLLNGKDIIAQAHSTSAQLDAPQVGKDIFILLIVFSTCLSLYFLLVPVFSGLFSLPRFQAYAALS